MAKMGIGMINMYISMVEEEFGPLRRKVDAQHSKLKEQVTRQVRKELGIYDLHEERVKLELRIEEVESQINMYEKSSYSYRLGRRSSKLGEMVNDRMKEIENGVMADIRKAQAEAVRKIRLSGLTGDASDVFKDLPKMIKALEKKVPKTKLIDALKSKK